METIKKILADIRPEFDFESSTDFIEDGYMASPLVGWILYRKISCLSKQLLRLSRKMEDHYDCYI